MLIIKTKMPEQINHNQLNQELLPPLTQAEFDSWQAPEVEVASPWANYQGSLTDSDRMELWGSDYKKNGSNSINQVVDNPSHEQQEVKEKVPKQRLRKFGSALLTFSAYTVQALHVGKEQVKSYGYSGATTAASLASKYSEILSPKLDDLAYRRGEENRWRKVSKTALKIASVGLANTAPIAKNFAHNSLNKYEESVDNSEYNDGGGKIVKSARKRTEGDNTYRLQTKNERTESQLNQKRRIVEKRVGAQPKKLNIFQV